MKPNPNSIYLNWDYLEDRNKILNKYTELFKNLRSTTISDKKPCLKYQMKFINIKIGKIL
ncbi:hypothetical protein N7280_06645 [Rickettsia rhipicephali]|uniref:hypothetical protein n=1 Tax=Rickettsia rhipicephali TaxID=33992 RepID=UPI002254FA88|nr:hypothetical protein [Rickettsia rhipicephali]MCX4080246.1 hypothetical protein [Rickettsia rhipicephali]